MTENVSPEMVERMIVAIRLHAAGKIVMFDSAMTGANLSVEAEFRAIAAELPAPVDPDLVEARRMESEQAEANGFIDYALSVRNGDQDNDGPVRCRFEGIKRGRTLATQGDR